jgi:hypothetical protein
MTEREPVCRVLTGPWGDIEMNRLDPHGLFPHTLDLMDMVASIKTPEDRDKARINLRTSLLKLPSFRYTGVVINRDYGHIAYTSKEQSIRKKEQEESEARQQAIEADIAAGVTPWQAHSRHNTESRTNTHIIGFYNDGVVRPLYGEPFFESTHGMKEVHMIKLETPQVNGEVHRSTFWDALPRDLQETFAGGAIPVTGTNDLYRLDEEEIKALAESTDPFAYQKHLKEKIATADDGYYLLYYGGFMKNIHGRTGVLMQKEADTLQPVTVHHEGHEFLIELKKVGTKEGGFGGKTKWNTGTTVIIGGGYALGSEREIAMLEYTDFPDGPQPVGSIAFTNDDGEVQGVTLRLSPSTVRASMFGPDAFPDIQNPDIGNHVFRMHARLLAEQIHSTHPYIIGSGSAHSENILLWKDKATYTDSEDKRAFDDPLSMRYRKRHAIGSPRDLLYEYLELSKEIPGFDSRTNTVYRDGLIEGFAEKGYNLALEEQDESLDIEEKIWGNGGMAYKVYTSRKENGYFPESLHEDIMARRDEVTNFFGDAMASEKAFIEQFTTLTAKARAGLTLLSPHCSEEYAWAIDLGIKLLDEEKAVSKSEAFASVIEFITTHSLPADLKQQAYEDIQPLMLMNSLIHMHDDFLNQELDVCFGVTNSNNDEGKSEIVDHKIAIEENSEALDAICANPQALYAFLSDSEGSRKLLQISTYNQEQMQNIQREQAAETHVVFEAALLPPDIDSASPSLSSAQVDWAGEVEDGPGRVL